MEVIKSSLELRNQLKIIDVLIIELNNKIIEPRIIIGSNNTFRLISLTTQIILASYKISQY